MTDSPSADQHAASPDPRDPRSAAPRVDPLQDARRRAQYASDSGGLPSTDGVGPAAGTPSLSKVTVREQAGETPTAPSLGGTPLKEPRPLYRSSQLDHADPDDNPLTDSSPQER